MSIIQAASLPIFKDIPVYRGDTVTDQFIIADGTAAAYTPRDLTDYVFTAKVKDINGEVLFTLSEGDGLTVTDADGLVSLELMSERSEMMLPGCCYKYDIQSVNSGRTTTWIAGKMNVSKDIT